MSGFQVSKLILLSHKETASAEYSLTAGLNVILGRNDTGKSSLVKSIFHTFGCGVKMEASWQNLLDTSLVVWSFRDKVYTLMRRLDVYYLYEGDASAHPNEARALGRYERTTSELAPALVGDILGVKVTWVTKNGATLPPSLSHLFSFCYIDQDTGWSAVGESFKDVNYVSDWKKNLIKYVVGYQDNNFFELLREIKTLQSELSAKSLQQSHISEFIDVLGKEIEARHGVQPLQSRPLSYNVAQGNGDLRQISSVERTLLMLGEALQTSEVDHYNLNRQFAAILELQRQLESDHEFAMESASDITCPFCGTVHNNDLRHRSAIIKDVDEASKLATELRRAIKERQAESDSLQQRIRRHRVELLRLQRGFKRRQEHVEVFQEFKIEGKFELFRETQARVKILQDEVNTLAVIKQGLDAEKKRLDSPARRKAISTRLSEKFGDLLLKVGHTPVKLKAFLPELKTSGSKLPRAIFAYYVSLFLYNGIHSHFPIPWLVVDTPNQQGQDDENLRGIFDLLQEFTGHSEQVIIASERETGYEDKAHVIRLEQQRKLLTEVAFKQHQALVDHLLVLANNLGPEQTGTLQ